MEINENHLKEIIGYLPQNIVERIISNPEKDLIKDSTKLDAAVLFSDISGFTSISEALSRIGKEGAEEMSRILNNYFENVEDIVRQCEGYIQKIAGDSTMIFFIKEEKESYKDIVMKAIQCAISIQELINNKFQYIDTIAGIFKLAMKIGISSGIVYSNVVGDTEYGFKHILLGEPILESSNAEGKAISGEIWLDKNSAKYVNDNIEFINDGDYSKIVKTKFKKKAYSYIKPINITSIPAEKIKNTIEKIQYYLPEEVYDRIMLGQTDFLGEHRRITVLFVSFSGLDYKSGMENVGKQIQEYILFLNKIIYKYGGRLQEYEGGDKGDKVLIYFGVPKSYGNDVERALMCANEIIKETPKLGFITKQHIGIATGYVYVGVVGYELYKSYTTIGDIVNVSSRLMQYSMANNYSIIVESNTFEKTEKKMDFKELELIQVKNRVQPIKVYEFKGVKQSQFKGYFEKRQSNAQSIVGRKKELELFEECLKKAKQGEGQILSIVGEAGIGKTRLSDEFVSRLFNENIKGFGGDCLSYGTNIPYLSWTEILRDFFEIEENIIKDIEIEKIKNHLELVDPNFVSKLPIVSNILGIEMEDNELTRHLDAKLKKENFFSIVLESLKHRAKNSDGLFLIIEDAHWIDSISLELLNYVCRNISNEKIIIIIVHRPLGDVIDKNFKEIFDYSYHTRFSLNYLEPAETIELVNRRLNIENISDDFKKLIVSRSQGNPFFIEEIVNSLIDNEYIEFNRQKGKYEILKDLSDIDIPDTIQDIVLSRIDKLDESSKLTLKVSSVIGRQFKFRVLSSIYPDESQKGTDYVENILNENLSRLRTLDLMKLDIPEPEAEYIFKHVITQEVSYASLLFSYRRALHEKIAQFFEMNYPDRIDLITHHYENTDNTKKKIEYFEKAAKLSESNYANQEAIEYYQKLIKIIDEEIEKTKIQTIDEYHKNIDDLWEDGDINEMKDFIKKSEELINDIKDDRVMSNYKSDLAKVYFRESKYTQALNEFKASLEINKKLGSKERIAVDLFNIGVTYFKSNELENSKQYMNDALSIAKEINFDALIYSVEEAMKEYK